MAIYHLNASIISRKQGRSCVAAAAYRASESLFNAREDRIADFTAKQGTVFSEILAPKVAPAWVKDREKLWNEVDIVERRKDAQTAREVDIALPRELTHQQHKELVHQFCQRAFVSKGMVADISIHTDEDNHNPHAHVLLTMRSISKDGFGNKVRGWNQKSLLRLWRKEWERTANRALGKANINERIDHRSHKDRDIELKPTIHEGPGGSRASSKDKPISRPQTRRSKFGKEWTIDREATDEGTRAQHNEWIKNHNVLVLKDMEQEFEPYEEELDITPPELQVHISKRMNSHEMVKTYFHLKNRRHRLSGLLRDAIEHTLKEEHERFQKIFKKPNVAKIAFTKLVRSRGFKAAYFRLNREPHRLGLLVLREKAWRKDAGKKLDKVVKGHPIKDQPKTRQWIAEHRKHLKPSTVQKQKIGKPKTWQRPPSFGEKWSLLQKKHGKLRPRPQRKKSKYQPKGRDFGRDMEEGID